MGKSYDVVLCFWHKEVGRDIPAIRLYQNEGSTDLGYETTPCTVYPNGVADVNSKVVIEPRVSGYQFYDYNDFSLLVEVDDNKDGYYAFILDTMPVDGSEPHLMDISDVERPYVYFNEYVRKRLG
jgi:hypothetical protein